MSHKHFRSGFGRSAFAELKAVMERWRESGYSTDDETYQAAQNVIRAYVHKHRAIGKPIPQFVGEWFADEVASADKACGNEGNAGVKIVRASDKLDNKTKNYATLFEQRTSVREYTGTSVDMQAVQEAIAISMKTPSVCNRQAYRILLVQNQELVKRALELQGGWRGYDMPPLLALISVDVRSFVSVEERNEPYIDGGLFTMAFLTALEYESLASCPLNTMMRKQQEHDIRNLLGIPDYEVLIAFVAIGNFPESIESPISFRYKPEIITRELR
ncbi:nitroreductase family protein [Bifidobacterium angulatum]|uniref:nitroreductase family protein n=1 Tax=Bifidobacterium angulatum TaxID=1683 RepID=UPI00265A174B|nr:nitroreductase family protein [Bifidobacterium angulatum]